MPFARAAIARRGYALEQRIRAGGSGWVLWACFAALVLVLSIDRADTLENVFSVYRDAGLRWLHGEDLYPAQYRFNYFPPSAVFFAVFSGMPYGIEGALWRIANIAVFAAGLWRLGAHGDETATARHFMISTVVTVILSASAARYGQLTLAMSGLMMATATDLEEGHLWRAAIFAALAVAMKPLAVVLALLLFAVYPRARWRVALALLVFFVLRGGDEDNLNVRAAVLHVIGDLLGSVAAVIASIVILTTGWTPIDPLLSLLVALIILRSAWRVVAESSHILLEGSPPGFDSRAIGEHLRATLPYVLDVHHVHAWSISQERPMVTLHACVTENTDATVAVREIKRRLAEDFRITHATIEIEYGACGDDAASHKTC